MVSLVRVSLIFTLLASAIGFYVCMYLWTYPKVTEAVTRPPAQQQFCEVLAHSLVDYCVRVRFMHAPGGVRCVYRHGETDVRPPDEELLVYFKQFQIGFEYPCYYQADEMARVTFDRPETDDNAVLSIFALFPIALVFFYALYRLFTHQKVYSSPESLLLDAEMMMERHKESLREADVENQKRMAGLLAKVEREQERRLEMSAELSRERAERMRGAEDMKEELRQDLSKLENVLQQLVARGGKGRKGAKGLNQVPALAKQGAQANQRNRANASDDKRRQLADMRQRVEARRASKVGKVVPR